MPAFMGVIDSNKEVIKSDMIFGECESCGLLQNINLIDPGLVYLNNHNTEVVGEIWINHYIEFSNFIKENSIGEVILEIGDPSAKLANKLKSFYGKWIIIEPNTNLQNYDNVEIIRKFFDGVNPSESEIHTIIHSHVFEHIYEPIKFLKDCNKILSENGVIIFSIPNIKWLLENNSLPTSILHFEHTYYVNNDNIELFLNKSGFKSEKIQEYKNHSLFIKAKKNNDVCREIEYNKFYDKEKFMDLVDFFEKRIEEINSKLSDRKYYLYSAHINSQYLLNNGISLNIEGLLERSNSKIGKELYGYNYKIYSPDKILNEKNPIVVASHMGAYYEEIKRDLINVNPTVIIL